MKLCLVILGNSLTRVSACRVMESLGFANSSADDSVFDYVSGEGEALDVVVLDWEKQESGSLGLMRRLDALKRRGQSIVLFCNEGREKEQLDLMLGQERDKWLVRSFDVENLVHAFLN